GREPGTRETERGEGDEGRAGRRLRRELVGEELRELAGIAEPLLLPVGDMVRGLGEDAPPRAPPNPDRGDLLGQPAEVAMSGVRPRTCHARTASTARENSRHSSRRTDSASRPDRVMR